MFAVVELKTKAAGASQASWSERRMSVRVSTNLQANLRARGTGVRVKAEVVDVSVTGCRLLTWQYAAGDEVLLAIGHLAPIPARICWVRNGAAGVRFTSRLHPSIVDHLGRN